MSLSTKERKDKILAAAYEAGDVEVKRLAAAMEVSEATVRRDLRSLADAGELQLVYGGATLPQHSDFSFRSKSMRNVDSKRVLAKLAAQLITDNATIFLDSGTTCLEVCPHLRPRQGLTVIVNSVRMAPELSVAPGINLILIGGQYRPDRMDAVGPMATSALDQLRGYTAFIGADGLSMDYGITASDIESAHLHRLAARNAKETILLVDHTKFKTPSLYKITEFDAISRIVTDQAPSEAWMQYLNQLGIEVIYPQETQEERG